MAGAALLDLDKPMMYFVGRNPFPMRVRRFHEMVQNESEEGLPNEIRFGVGFALADVLFSALARRRVAPVEAGRLKRRQPAGSCLRA